jgi:D-3-phosphoglycerate dehydrogenase / 2-oxoglutarate reductase
MSYCVVVADRIAESGLKLLAGEPGFRVVNVAGKGPEALAQAVKDAQALIVRSETRVTSQIIAQAHELKVIARAGIGVDTIDVAAATRRGIAVLNAPGANTVSAAEHTFALLLALVRRIAWAADSMRRGEWDRKKFEGTELRGKVLGVVGLGRVGGTVAQYGQAFGMSILAYDPYLPPDRADALKVKLVTLDEVLRQADVVTLHVALTDQTRHLINTDRLGLMKPTAVLVNAARGELVDEAALAEAVKSGRIAGAALDVFGQEPLPADSVLRGIDRVILTPHLGASTTEAQERVAVEICRAVRDALVDGDVSGAVNIPGISREVLMRIAPMLDLARRLGRLVVGLSSGAPRVVEVNYGGKDDSAQRPVQIAAVEGMLVAMGVEFVSFINALVLAEERGIQVTRRAGAAEAGFETTIGVRLQTAEGRHRVVGALVGNAHGRVIAIDDYKVDVPPAGWMLVLQNRDVPGVIGRVGTLLAEAAVNIGSYHQARLNSGGSTALAAIAVDHRVDDETLKRLRAVPDVLEVRLVDLGE